MPSFPNSSAIRRAEYDDATATLRIWFAEGHAYDYYGVPRHHFDDLCRAASKGGYFNDHIRDRYGRG